MSNVRYQTYPTISVILQHTWHCLHPVVLGSTVLCGFVNPPVKKHSPGNTYRYYLALPSACKTWYLLDPVRSNQISKNEWCNKPKYKSAVRYISLSRSWVPAGTHAESLSSRNRVQLELHHARTFCRRTPMKRVPPAPFLQYTLCIPFFSLPALA